MAAHARHGVAVVMMILLLGVLCCLPALADDTTDDSYRVGKGDVLEITVYDHPEMTTTVRIGADGTIIVPLLDSVKVAGLTTSEISLKLHDLLADGYIVNPQVNVFVKEYREQKAVILGQAGNTVTLKREVDGKVKEQVIDLDRLVEQGDTSLNVAIKDGDKVFVTKAGYFYVTGEVKKPDSYKLQDDLTVLKAIAMAGGLTDIADRDGVKIIRKINGKETVIKVHSMDERIQAEDVIVVPESFF